MEITGLFLAAPSLVQTGEEFALGLKVLCRPYFAPVRCAPVPSVGSPYNLSPRGIRYMDNVPPAWSGRVEFDGGDGYRGPGHYDFGTTHKGPCLDDHRPIARVEGIHFNTAGVKFITAREAASGIQARSNPIVVSDEPPLERLWWGDIHSQSFFTDGLRCPEELYSFARDEAFLDIFALSDHTEHLTDRQWDYFTAVTNEFDAPGSFATLVGLEWTNSEQGHRNVYYRGAGGPILRANEPAEQDLERLYEIARERGALVVPHHSANVTMGVPWELGHDPVAERLCEVHSVWGNSERPAAEGNPFPIRVLGGEKAGQHVRDALCMGRRYGLIGGGDIHDGRPGDELHSRQRAPEFYRLLHRQGIMGVWARELTREAVFDALWNRRCYATRHSGPRPIRVMAASEVPIASLEIVRGGQDWRRFEPGECVAQWGVEDREAEGADWYYVRLTRADGLMAWSSPVWVEQP